MIAENKAPKCKTKAQLEGDKFGLHNTRKNIWTIKAVYKKLDGLILEAMK